MTTRLTKLDARVLDLLSDDYYTLWEVCDYYTGLAPMVAISDQEAKCKTCILKYVRERLVDVLVGDMKEGNFQSVPKMNVAKLLRLPASWKKRAGKIIVITSTQKARNLLTQRFQTL
jgi:hypothetical protein